MIEGLLQKKGRGHTFSFLRPWTTRYFVLDSNTTEIAYYLDSTKKERKGKLSVKGGKIMESSEKDKPHMFEFLTSSGEVLVLAASDENQKKTWMNAFASCLEAPIADIIQRKEESVEDGSTNSSAIKEPAVEAIVDKKSEVEDIKEVKPTIAEVSEVKPTTVEISTQEAKRITDEIEALPLPKKAFTEDQELLSLLPVIQQMIARISVIEEAIRG